MRKQGRIFRKMAVLFFLLFLFPGVLTGCGRLQSTYEVKLELKQILPEATVLSVENGRRSNARYRYKKYTIENKGVVFTYKNYQGLDTMFGTTQAYSMNDYCERLFEYFAEDVDRIVKKYQVELEVQGSSAWIKNNIAHMKDIDNGINAMEEIYALMENYIPEAEWIWFEFDICLDTANYGKAQFIDIYQQGDWDAPYYRQLLYLNLKDAAEEGFVTEVEMPQELLDTIPQKYIRNLYINGEPYQSDRYEIRFLYNIRDGQYYTPVGFGIELDYNGGVEDYLQREIIERYYPDAEYTISMEDNTSSYQIGNDQYHVKRQKDGLIFYKNGTELPIAHESEVSNTHSGATYYYWVRADDFALLLGMSLDRVDESGVYLSLR